jgi:hypothetical protein
VKDMLSLKEKVKFSINLMVIIVKYYLGQETLGKPKKKIRILLAVLSRIKME